MRRCLFNPCDWAHPAIYTTGPFVGRPDTKAPRRLYEHLRGMGYSAMDALRHVYGPLHLPAVRQAEWMSGISTDGFRPGSNIPP